MRIFKLLLFGFLMLYLFNQLRKLPGSVEPFFIENSWMFFSCVVFIPINWYIEWRKWQLTLNEISHANTKSEQFNSFAAGMVTGFFTPSMLGNFIGRLPFFHRAQKIAVIYLTQYGNLGQFISTILFGSVAFIALRNPIHSFSFYFFNDALFVFVSILCLGFFFFFDELVGKIKWTRIKLKENISSKVSVSFKVKLLLLSCSRHFIFTLQFSLLLLAFGAKIDWSIVLLIWQVYFVVTLIPSLFFGKILIRDSVAWLILSSYGFDTHEVFSTTLWIWILNLLIPALFFLVIVNVNRRWAI